ncbi:MULTISPECIES: AAA family ATPase [Halorussus]|uniref:AAA family ATPase n=1 Tax=Halorussus TaxID=1070314 RepID=UPI00209FBE45|nr:AAA family ATPase [Halorussus vallis]USZ77459.1 AAA family ATPase [Halorussus vallis]
MTDTDTADARTPTAVVVCGLPGVGKTTVAEAVADRVGGRLLRTDVVRKEILADPEYTDEESRIVYDAVFERAEATLESGRSAVLDGTFKAADLRERARTLADATGAAFRLVRVECDKSDVRERIAAREDDASDADFAVHAQFREEFEPLARDHVTVDNSRGIAETRRQVADHFPE